MIAPICTVGPSRPRASPEPIASTPPANLTGRTANGAGSASPRVTASTCCTPLPAARGAKRCTIHRAVATSTAAIVTGITQPTSGH